MIRLVRHRLGLLKYRVQAATIGKMLAKRAARERAFWRQKLGNLPPIAGGAVTGAEVHILCGQRDVDMGVYATWSVARHLPVSKLYIHSDGSLGADHIALWRRTTPSAEFVDASKTDALADTALRNCPRLSILRRKQLYGRKLVDFHLVGEAKKFVLLDSDVLCFGYPEEFHVAAIAQDDKYKWIQDVRNSYTAAPEVLRDLTGTMPALRVNTGFAVVPRFGDEQFAILETLARALSSLDDAHPWMEQTLYALMAGPTGEGASRSYDVTPGRIREGQLVRHYVGNAMIRPLFFLEGVPHLMRQLSDEAYSGRAEPLSVVAK